jgi:hypothetical protein
MLLLLFKNFLWAAWWPYCTMLLAMEKAAQQKNQGAKPPPSAPRASAPPQEDRGLGRQQERVMASDAFNTEIPEPLRELMKMSIEQAKRAFEAFISTSEKAWKSLENSSPSGRAGLYALNAKIAEITPPQRRSEFRPGHETCRDQGRERGHGAAEPARARADGDLRPSIGGDARSDDADHPGGERGEHRHVEREAVKRRAAWIERRELVALRAVVELSARRDRPHLLKRQKFQPGLWLMAWNALRMAPPQPSRMA